MGVIEAWPATDFLTPNNQDASLKLFLAQRLSPA